MQITTYTVNENGLQQIREFLAENHNLGGDHFDNDMIHAWARDAEFQLGEGNGATIEIGAANSVSGNPICYTITEGGLDAEVMEIDD